MFYEIHVCYRFGKEMHAGMQNQGNVFLQSAYSWLSIKNIFVWSLCIVDNIFCKTPVSYDCVLM